MPVVNWDTIEDAEDFSPIPEDRYLAKIHECKEETTDNGDAQFVITFKVEHGQYKGRTVIDRLTFSAAGLKRVKFAMSRLGFNTEQKGSVAVQAAHLLGKFAIITIEHNTANDRFGNARVYNNVPWNGIERYIDGQTPLPVPGQAAPKPAAKATAATPAAAAEPAPITEEELPF